MKLSVSAYRAHASAHKKILSSSYQTHYGSTAPSQSSSHTSSGLFSVSVEPATFFCSFIAFNVNPVSRTISHSFFSPSLGLINIFITDMSHNIVKMMKKEKESCKRYTSIRRSFSWQEWTTKKRAHSARSNENIKLCVWPNSPIKLFTLESLKHLHVRWIEVITIFS